MPTKSSEPFGSFDVVVVPFPNTDRATEQRRPAVVVSTPALTRRHDLLWLAMITSSENQRWEDDVPIADLVVTGLPAPSVVRVAKLATVNTGVVRRRIGRLGKADASRVGKLLRSYLAGSTARRR